MIKEKEQIDWNNYNIIQMYFVNMDKQLVLALGDMIVLLNFS